MTGKHGWADRKGDEEIPEDQEIPAPGIVVVIDTRAQGQPGGRVLDNVRGAACGSGVWIILEDTDVDGAGPYLHQHP